MSLFSIDKNSPIPIYHQLESQVRELIQQGRLSPGDRLPNEIELSLELGVSRMTIRQAFIRLSVEGLLTRRRAHGTFVAPPRTSVSFRREQVRSMTEEVAGEGRQLNSRVLRQDLIFPPSDVHNHLDLNVGEKAVLIQRLRSVDGIPILIETCYHPYQRFPALLSADLNDRSIYEFLEREYLCRPRKAVDTIVAGLADNEEAGLLSINPGAPVMRLHRLGYDAEDQAIESTFAIYRADRYQIVIHYDSEATNPRTKFS